MTPCSNSWQARLRKFRQIAFFGAVALLLLLNFGSAGPNPAQADSMGGGGGHHGGGGGVGVGVGIGVGSILLNEAIRRSQQKHENRQAEPAGCPPGLVPSKHGCKKPGGGKDKGPNVAKCDPPRIYIKGKGCITPKQPEVAKCDHGEIYKKGKGCVKPREPQTASCDWPKVRSGKGCVCANGYKQRGHECFKPPVVVIEPPHVVPVGPVPVGPITPAGPGPEAPPHVTPAGPAPSSPPTPEPQPVAQPISTKPAPEPQPVATECLPQDLYDLLVDAYGKRPGLSPCPAACLPKPVFYSQSQLDDAVVKNGITWCENCIQVGGYIPLDSVEKLEEAGNVTICVNADMCRLPGAIKPEHQSDVRTLFKDLPAGVKNEGNIAVVVGNKDYENDLPDNTDGDTNADAVSALLVDQLGYKQENIIDLRDASLADLERVFGGTNPDGGEIAKRVDQKDPGDVFIYVASHGMVKEDDAKKVYLLPVDAKLDDLDQTAYPIQELYNNLNKTGARTIMLMLETNFAKNLDELIDPPNLPELEVEAMPVDPVPGLAVFKASDRDQKAIKDPEYGIGLFTRYLIEGLAGRADQEPIGNGDKRIDTVELYVYTADGVRNAARKSFGLEQKPLLGKVDNLVVGNLASQ